MTQPATADSEMIAVLERELAETDRGVMAIAWELDRRVEQYAGQLRLAHEELEQTNSEVMRSALELEAANRELDAFAHSVSHDLRAPLRSISGFTRILQESCGARLDEQGRDYLHRIDRACARMTAMIEDMLRLSRLARSELRCGNVDLAAMAREIALGFAEAAPERRVEFVILEGLAVHGDEGLLRNALENLLGNAWKFTGKTAAARIEVGRSDDPPAFFVRDNGAGFNMARAQQLFGAFQRLHREADFPGTGVGLATVQRIIQRHGGRIWAEAAEGQGATFYFTLREAEQP